MYDVVINNDLKVYQGADFRQLFTVLQGGVAVNLSSHTFTCKFKWKYTDVTDVFSLGTGTGITITDAPNGVFEIRIDNSVTGAVTFPTGGIENVFGEGVDLVFDCNAIAGSNTYQVLRGTAKMLRSANI